MLIGAVGEAGAHRIDLAGFEVWSPGRSSDRPMELRAHLRHRMMAIGRADREDFRELRQRYAGLDRRQRIVEQQRRRATAAGCGSFERQAKPSAQ